MLSEVIDGLQLGLGASMYLLLITRFIREALQMYSVTNQFQLNRYMGLLTRDGIFYFLAYVLFLSYSPLLGQLKDFINSIFLYALINLLIFIGNISMNEWWVFLRVAEYLPVYTLVPRLILSLRELYSRDLRGRCGTGIDTAFGLTLSPSVSDSIVFAENAQNDASEWGDEIVLEECDARSTSHV